LGKLSGIGLEARSALARATDSFDRLSQINKASIVMLSETGVVPKAMAARNSQDGGLQTRAGVPSSESDQIE
jgi:hypothetical protein